MDKKYDHIREMEKIYDHVLQTQSAFEKAIEEYRDLQPEIQKLEEYYASRRWKDDFAADERGDIPGDIKRGVLSEDGIYNLLDRNKEILEMLGDTM